MYQLVWTTDLGPLTAVATDKGLAALFLRPADAASATARLAGHGDGEIKSDGSPILDKARQQVDEYLDGQRREFDLPLDYRGTVFQKDVWQALCRIPLGRVATYGRIAREIGRPKAARAVGQAVGANPLPIIIPCHRVVSSAGLGGFSSGLAVKRILLGIEGVTEADMRRVREEGE